MFYKLVKYFILFMSVVGVSQIQASLGRDFDKLKAQAPVVPVRLADLPPGHSSSAPNIPSRPEGASAGMRISGHLAPDSSRSAPTLEVASGFYNILIIGYNPESFRIIEQFVQGYIRDQSGLPAKIYHEKTGKGGIDKFATIQPHLTFVDYHFLGRDTGSDIVAYIKGMRETESRILPYNPLVIGISGEVGNNKKMVKSGADASFLRGKMTIENVVNTMTSLYKENKDHKGIFYKQLRKNATGFSLPEGVENVYKGRVMNIKSGGVYIKISPGDVPMIIKVKLPFIDIEDSFSGLGQIPHYFLGKVIVHLCGKQPGEDIYYGFILPTDPRYIGACLSERLLDIRRAELAEPPVPEGHFLDFYTAGEGLKLFKAVRGHVREMAPKK